MMLGKTPDINQNDVRQQLQKELLNAVKNCQTRFGGRTELATELDDHIKVVCTCFEFVLSHGLRSKPQIKKNSALKQVTDKVLGVNGTDHVVFWHFVREHLTKHERERYEVLRQVWTDIGRGRAWLRASLNERSLERYLLSILDGLPDLLQEYYEDWAFIRDQERSTILPTAAAGLGSILFAISIDKPELNHGGGVVSNVLPEIHLSSPCEPVISAPPVAVPNCKKNEGRRKKKIPPNIISFDNDESDTTYSHSDVSVNTPPSPNPINNLIGRSNSIIVGEVSSGVSVSVGVECLDDHYLEAAISDSELDLTQSLSSGVSLRPITNGSVGELIPVPLTEETHSSEDSLSVPSFSEDVEVGTAVEVREDNGNLNDNYLKNSGGLNKEDEVIRLRRSLIAERETTAALRLQLTESCKQYEDRVHTTETRIQTLNRENEVLKHQLRKYVMAVQALEEDNEADEEARMYEQKLIQVAEMHGELMELNDRLQRQLSNKEGMIKRLREELEALRGPLAIDSDEDDFGPTLVNLWIPSVFLSGQSPNTHHVYQVHLRVRDEEWNIYRRYTQFYNFHKLLKKQYSVITTFQFPPKKTIGNKDAKFVEERRHRLQQYLRRIINLIILNNSQLAAAPSKTLLISQLPFFGENLQVPDEQQRPNSKTPFSRRALPDSPQYTGL